MAKQVLLNFLIQHLGNFVDGLSKENLRLGIFSGNLELRNLTLKADVFDSLNLPIRLVYGVIKSINIKIPWANLGKNPVVVNISNVLLHLEFCDENLRYSAHELEEITQKLKQSILEQAQRRAFSQACGNLKLSSAAYRLETTKHQSFSAFIQTYFQRVITKLLFNVEAVINNIHVRYTDKMCASKLVAAGVTIQSLSLVTPQHSAPTHAHGPLCKITRIENVNVYWDCQATNFTSPDARINRSKSRNRSIDMGDDTVYFDLEDWENGMMNIISIASNSSSKNFLKNCIIAGPNAFEFHIKHHATVDNNSTPKLEFSCDIGNLKLTVDQSQLEQIVDVLRRVAVQKKRLNMTLFRPQQRPAQDARGWWLYAYQLVTGREDLIHRFKDRLQLCLQNRDRYIDLVMKSFTPPKAHEYLPQDPLESFIISSHAVMELTAAERKEKADIETMLPIQALIVYQNLAMEFLVRREFTKQIRLRDEEKEARADKSAKKNRWWSKRAAAKSAQSGAQNVRSSSNTFMNSSATVRGSMMHTLRNLVPRGQTTERSQSADIPFEEFEHAMVAELEAAETESRQDVLLLRCNFNIRTNVIITVNRKVVLEATVAAESCSTVYSLTHVCCTVNINELTVEEKMCPSSRKPMVLGLYRHEDDVHPSGHHTEEIAIASQQRRRTSMNAVSKTTLKAIASIGHHVHDLIKEIEDDTKKGFQSIKEFATHHEGSQRGLSISPDPTTTPKGLETSDSGRDSTPRQSGFNMNPLKGLWGRKETRSESPTAGGGSGRKRMLWMDTFKDGRINVGNKKTRSQRMMGTGEQRLSPIQINYEYNASGRSSIQVTVTNVEVNLNLGFLYLFSQEFVKTVASLKQATRSFWSGDFISQAPYCTVVTDKISGKSSVQVVDAVSDKDNNVFKKYFNKLITSMKTMIGEQIVVDIAVLAPKIYVDPDFAGDIATAMIDIGSIGVTGFVSVAAHNFELTSIMNEMSVTCGMPLPPLTSATRVLSAGNRKDKLVQNLNNDVPGGGLGFLMHPITLHGKFSNAGMSSSDGTINMSLEGTTVEGKTLPVFFELDNQRSIELMILIEHLVDITNSLSIVFGRYPILFAVPEANLFDHFTDKVPTVSHLKSLVSVEFACSDILLAYNYPAPASSRGGAGKMHALTLALSNFHGVLNQRIYDTKLNLVMSSFVLKDTYRPPHCATIAASQPKASTDISLPLIQLAMSFGNRVKTNAAQVVFPDFEASFSFDILELSVDAHLMFHLNELLSPVIQHAVSRLVARQSRDDMLGGGMNQRYEWVLSNMWGNNGGQSTNGTFVTAASHRYGKLLDKDIVKLSFKIDVLNVKTAMVDVDEDGSILVMPICALHMHSVETGVNLSMGIARRARASIGALEVIDCREISKEFHYKRIVGGQNNGGSPKSDSKKCLFALEYSNQISNDESTSNQLMNVSISGVQVNACVDVIIDISSSLVGIVFAILHLASPVAASATNSPSKQVQYRVPGLRVKSPAHGPAAAVAAVAAFSGANLKPHRKVVANSTFKLKAIAHNTSMLLIADPMLESTGSILASYLAEVTVVITDSLGSDHLARVTNESMALSVSNVNLCFVSDTGRYLQSRLEASRGSYSPQSSNPFSQSMVHEVFSVDCTLRRELKQSIPVVAEIAVVISDIELAVSLGAVRTVSAVLARSSLAGLMYIVAPVDSIAYCIWGSHNSKEERVMYDISVSTNALSIETVSDHAEMSTGSVPSIRSSVHSCTFKFDGALHPRIYVDATSVIIEIDVQDVEGSGSATCSMDFYHPIAKLWEPVVEPFEVSLVLGEKNNEIVFAIEVTDNLRLNVSGAVIESILRQYSKLLWLQNRGSLVQREEIVALPSSQALRKPTMLSKGLALLDRYQNNTFSRLLSRAYLFKLKKAKSNSQLPTISLVNASLSSFKFVLGFDENNGHSNQLAAGDRFLMDTSKALGNFCKVAVRVGDYDWSNEITVDLRYSSKQEFIIRKNGAEVSRLVVEAWDNRSVDGLDENYYEIVVYSVAAFIDTTGLGVCALSTVNGRNVVRSTFLSHGRLSTAEKVRELTDAYESARPSKNASKVAVWATGQKALIAPQSIYDIHFNSLRVYQSGAMKAGRKVYTDRSFVWTHIPPLFQRQYFFQTACDDYGSAISKLISFSCSFPVFVFVLVESSAAASVLEGNHGSGDTSLHWLLADGYVKTTTTLVAVQRGQKENTEVHGAQEERHFIPFGKLFKENEVVTLGAAGVFGRGGHMYSVCIVHTGLIDKADSVSVDVLHSVLSGSSLSSDTAERCWLDGNMGLCSVHADDNALAVGFINGNCWSKKLKLNSLSTDKMYVEVENREVGQRYQLGCQITRMPGLFFRTAQVKIMPYYCILNCCDEYVEVIQQERAPLGFEVTDTGSVYATRFYPYETKGWHKTAECPSCVVRLRLGSSKWSFGGVDINEVGSSVLMLAPDGGGHDRYILHVDVKLADDNDCCAVAIVIWKESLAVGSSISISNETLMPICIEQADLEFDNSSVPTSALSLLSIGSSSQAMRSRHVPVSDFALTVPAQTRLPFGWADPSKSKDAILVSCPTMSSMYSSSPSRHQAAGSSPREELFRLEILRLNEVTKVTFPSVQGPVNLYLAVQARGNGRVVRIVQTIEELTSNGKSDSLTLASAHEPAVSSTTTGGAVAAGAVVGTLLMGPIGTVLVGGGTYVLISKMNADAQAQLNIDLANTAEHQAREMLTGAVNQVQRIRTKNFDGYSSNINFTLALSLAQVSVGLFVEKPERREFLALYIDEFEGIFKFNAISKSSEISIKDIQLDSFSETAVSQVVLKSKRSLPSPSTKPPNASDGSSNANNNISDLDESKFFHSLIVEEFHPEEDTRHYKYIGLRMLEVGLTIDSATLQLLAIDLGVDFSFLSTEQVMATHGPMKWIEQYNVNQLLPSTSSLLADVRKCQVSSQERKVFIENLVIHPIKLTLSFHQTSLPRKLEQLPAGMLSVGLLSFLPTFASLENATIHLESFIVCNVMESLPAVTSRVLTSKLRDLQYQLAPLAGSLTAIGGPMVLAKKVGGGVSGLIYEVSIVLRTVLM
jgi:hypothetical protein